MTHVELAPSKIWKIKHGEKKLPVCNSVAGGGEMHVVAKWVENTVKPA